MTWYSPSTSTLKSLLKGGSVFKLDWQQDFLKAGWIWMFKIYLLDGSDPPVRLSWSSRMHSSHRSPLARQSLRCRYAHSSVAMIGARELPRALVQLPRKNLITLAACALQSWHRSGPAFSAILFAKKTRARRLFTWSLHCPPSLVFTLYIYTHTPFGKGGDGRNKHTSLRLDSIYLVDVLIRIH